MSENKYIGIDEGLGGLICFDCAYRGGLSGELITQEAYPDGYTCEKCFEPKFDQDYKPEGN